MARLVEGILGLSGTTAYVVVGLLAFGEAAAFIGLLLPGELAVLLGGVVVSGGEGSLPLMVAVAAVAAVLGDSVGYEIGRRFGPRIIAWEPFSRRFGDQVERASAYMVEKGGRAVFLGRWTSVLRALVPGLAGMSRMPYGRFLLFNIAGGVAWATMYVLAGYVVGASWRRFDEVAGRASLLLLLVIVLAVVVRWETRRLLARTDVVRDRLHRIGQHPLLARLGRRYAAQIHWVADRLTPRTARGLGWTAWIVVTGLSTWAVGAVLRAVLAREAIALLDRPVSAWIASNSTDAAADVAGVISRATDLPLGALLVTAVAALVWALAGRAAGLRVLVAGLVTGVLVVVLDAVVPTSTVGAVFPSAEVALVTATATAAAASIGQRRLAAGIRTAGVGLVVLVVVSMAALVGGGATVSTVVGGMAVGLLVAAGGEVTARLVAPGPGPQAGEQGASSAAPSPQQTPGT